MRKITVTAIVVVVVGFAGWAVTGARNHKGLLPTGIAVAATAIDSGKPASVASRPSSASGAKLSAAATSRPAGAPTPSTRPADNRPAENAMAAVRRAADARKHLFIFVQENEDEQTRAARKTFAAALGKLGEKAQQYAANRDAAPESEFVDKFGLKSAPMPVVLVLAPNGAVTGGFLGSRLTEQQLLASLASPVKQQCLKALQDRKLVFLCAQNGTTKSNDTAMKGVKDFKADTRFAEFTEIVTVNPADEDEKQFLTELQVAPKPSEATTIFLAPPGAIVAKFTGATNKDVLVAALQKASAGCGAGGCGPKGCGPKK